MKLFIRNLILFAITSLIIFTGLVIAERMILNRQGRFRLSERDKYVILGHSHPQMDYDDKLIDSSLNLASSGEAYFYTYIKLNKILESNQDKKILFIEYTNNNIKPAMNNWIWDDIHILDKYKLYSAYTRYNETKLLYSKNPKTTILCNIKSVINNAYYIFNLKNITVEEKMGGYYHLVRDKTDSLLQALITNPPDSTLDTNFSYANVAYLKKIIDVCREKGIALYLIRSPLHPIYDAYRNEVKFREFLNNDLQGVEFLDFKNCSFTNEEFGDLEHLNYRGAKKYSLFFNRLLKSGLLEKQDKQKFIEEEIAKEKLLDR